MKIVMCAAKNLRKPDSGRGTFFFCIEHERERLGPSLCVLMMGVNFKNL